MVKSLSVGQEAQVQSLGWEDYLEKEMATHSSILAWRIPWTEEPGGYSPWGREQLGHYWVTNTLYNKAFPGTNLAEYILHFACTLQIYLL